MNSLPKYPSTKPTNIPWIGEVPEHWEVTRIKHCAASGKTSFIDGDWIESPHITDSGIRYITTGNVGVGKYKEQGGGFISEETFIKLNCTEVFPGDLLISRLNLPIGRSCIVPDLGYRIITSVDNVILRPSDEISREFLKYFMCSSGYLEYTELIGRGTTMTRISRTMLGNIEMLLPPLSEQTHIARYLDHKTALIDAYLARKRRMITLLKEHRQALISRAVTKGLDPNAPMKHSGIEWIGEVPAHWEVKALKFFLEKVGSGVTPRGGSESYVDEGIPLLRSQNVHFSGLRLDDVAYITEEVHATMSNSKVYHGEVLLNITGASIGRCCLVDKRIDEANVNQHVCRIRTNMNLRHDFLVRFLSSDEGQLQIRLTQVGTSREGLTLEDLKSFVITVPSAQEQIDIALYLDEKAALIDDEITRIQTSMERVREYRQALISAVVTGKADVREVEVPEVDQMISGSNDQMVEYGEGSEELSMAAEPED